MKSILLLVFAFALAACTHATQHQANTASSQDEHIYVGGGVVAP